MKLNAGPGEASHARHQFVSPSVVVRFANCGLGYERFSNEVKAHLHQTEHPNALPASWRCPDHKGVNPDY